MILNNSMLKYSLVLGFATLSLTTLGQVQDTVTKPPTIEEVEVIRDYRPILADAVKIRRSPDLSNMRVFQPKLSYSTLDKKLDIPSGLHQLIIQEMPPLRPDIMTNNYAKIGLGNLNTYLAELYVNTGTDDTSLAGFFVKHLSQKGDLNEQKFSEQNIGAFGRKLMDQVTLTGEVGYNRYGTAFYGFNPEQPDLNLNPETQAFNDLYLKGEVLKNYDPAEDDISYSLKADGYIFSDKFSAKENAFALSGYFNKAMNVFNLGINASVDLTSVHGESYKMGNSIARINPYIRFKSDYYRLTLGANFVSEFGDISSSNLFPAVEGEFDVIPGYATLFAGVKGDAVKTSLRSLAKENPYLNQNIDILNKIEKINGYAGVKGNVGATLGYKGGIYYKEIENLPLFVNNPASPNKFDVIYDNGDKNTTLLGFEGEINVRVSETVNLGGKFNIEEYTLASEERAWFLPKTRLTSFARINISDQIFVNGEVLFGGESSAKVYDNFNADQSSYTIKTLPTFIDLSGAIEYRVDRKFGIYVRANNLLGKNYERYLYYPRLGLNVIGGLNYSF
jgi:hypothetical protein